MYVCVCVCVCVCLCLFSLGSLPFVELFSLLSVSRFSLLIAFLHFLFGVSVVVAVCFWFPLHVCLFGSVGLSGSLFVCLYICQRFPITFGHHPIFFF